MVRFARIAGFSMSPGLMPGDLVVAFRCAKHRYRPGDRVLLKHPQDGMIVQRIEEIADDSVWLKGDSKIDTGHEPINKLPFNKLVGRVICAFR